MSECKSCGAAGSQLRRRVIANGSIQFVAQCLTCGRSASNPVAKSSLKTQSLTPWDESLAKSYDEEQALQRQDEKAEWFEQHDDYLRTPAWRAKRAAVLLRAKGLCEGCGLRPATQVHHLSYEHWQDELLWELVAICRECHERVHAERKVLVIGLKA